jgi:hypothetical protein
MDVSVQLHTSGRFVPPTALAPTELEVGWDSNPVWTVYRREKSHAPVGNRTTILTNSIEQNPSEANAGSQLVKKFPAFHATRRFIAAFTRAATRPYSESDRMHQRINPGPRQL